MSSQIPSKKALVVHKWVRLAHRTLPFAIFPLGVVNCILGIKSLFPVIGIPVSVGYVLLAISPIVSILGLKLTLSLLYRRANNKEGESDIRALPEYSWEDVASRVYAGNKWIIIEETICE